LCCRIAFSENRDALFREIAAAAITIPVTLALSWLLFRLVDS
jgi:hypothetical protein